QHSIEADRGSKYYFLLRIILVFFFPLGLTCWIVKPFSPPLELNTNFKTLNINSPEFISTSTLNNFRELAVAIFDAPLNLGFRELCIKNNGFISINGKLISQDLSDKLSGAGAVSLELSIGSSTSAFLVKPGQQECVTFNKKEKNISYNLSEKKFLLKPDNSILEKYVEPSNNPEKPGYTIEIGDIHQNVVFSYRVSLLDMIVKFLLIFVFWNSLLLLVIKLYKFLKSGIKEI
ncbi:MAG: hypothetical protein AAB602_04020, partial [Patescibacteria group bacterium]